MPNKRTIESYLTQFNLTEEYLRDAYLIRNLSLPDIRAEKGIGFKACANLLRHFCIPVRSISTAKTLPSSKEKTKASCIKRYGVENPSQSDVIKTKKKQTFINHYGVDNIWKSKQYYKWLDDYMIRKYGVIRISNDDFRSGKTSKKWWDSLSLLEREEQIKKILKSLHKAASKKNTLELRIAAALDVLGVEYVRAFSLKKYIADFYLPKFNLIIECFGDFWHGNPNHYAPLDMIKFPKSPVMAKTLWEKDKIRLDTYKKMGYDVLVLWETEIKELDKSHMLPQRIMEEIAPK
jgi:G:T-mismatch repair DNA endonuclease (very short patch repair protein)